MLCGAGLPRVNSWIAESLTQPDWEAEKRTRHSFPILPLKRTFIPYKGKTS